MPLIPLFVQGVRDINISDRDILSAFNFCNLYDHIMPAPRSSVIESDRAHFLGLFTGVLDNIGGEIPKAPTGVGGGAGADPKPWRSYIDRGTCEPIFRRFWDRLGFALLFNEGSGELYYDTARRTKPFFDVVSVGGNELVRGFSPHGPIADFVERGTTRIIRHPEQADPAANWGLNGLSIMHYVKVDVEDTQELYIKGCRPIDFGTRITGIGSFAVTFGDEPFSDGPSVADDTYHVLIATIGEDDVVRRYVDGSPYGTVYTATSRPADVNDAQAQFGQIFFNGFGGEMSLAVYAQREWSAAEVSQISHDPFGPFRRRTVGKRGHSKRHRRIAVKRIKNRRRRH